MLYRFVPDSFKQAATTKIKFLNAKQTLQILPENRFLFLDSQAFQAHDPGYWPVDSHVRWPVGTKDNPVHSYAVYQVPESWLAVGQAIVVELV